jgi:PAS domain S-box-containing protein
VNRANDLFLLLLNLMQLRDRAEVTRLFLGSLGGLFGAPAFELSGTEPAGGVASFRVATRHTVFGHVVWGLPDPPAAEDRSLLHNAAQMLAVLLERLTFAEQMEKERAGTGLLADQRLVELTAAMDQLRLSRNASLNLVEDLTRENAMRQRAEAALAKRMVALTCPLDDPEGVAFEDLFNLEDIQRLQDQFAEATGVASIITRTDGTPITRPSRFCRLCSDIIRKTGKGRLNCYRSDAALGKLNPDGPIVQPCLSGGLWDAGAGISVGGRHIANWLIGQVRDETQADERMRAYAREIGADEEAFIAAFHEVPAMTRESFGKVARALHTLAGQLSESAYRNVQQARFIHDRQRAEEALRKNNKDLRESQRISHVGSWYLDVVTNQVVWTEELYNMYGFDPSLPPPPYAEHMKLFTPESWERLSTALARTRETGIPYTLELQTIRKDGSNGWMWVRGEVDVDSTGKTVGLWGAAQDITERKRAEEELARATALLQAAIDQTPAGMLIADAPDVRIRIANPAALGIRGQSAEPLTGIPVELHPRHWFTFWPDGTPVAPEELPLSRAILKGEIVKNEEVIIRRSDGELRHVLANAAPVRNAQGDIVAGVVVFLDVTELKRAEEALRESEAKFRSIAEQLPEMIALTDEAGAITYASPASVTLFGVSSAEMTGQHFPAFVDEALIPAAAAIFQNVVQNGRKLVNFEFRMKRGDGSTFDGELSGERYESASGRGSMVTIRDITERKRAEAEKEKLQAQLTQAQKMESVGRLAGGVAHDFNNMLGAILGNTSLALQDLPPESLARECLQEIADCARRSADLTRQLLAFARQQTIAPQVLDLNDTVAGMLKMLRRLIGEDIDLAWLPGKDLGPVKVDPSQIDQILANLCVNARDAIKGVGKITIETGNVVLDEAYVAGHVEARVGEYVRLAVSDNGCGMSPEVRAHLFEPFFTTKGLGQGTGLGLATVYGIVKQNNGFIGVYSEPGQGTTFQIHLPRHAAPTVSPAGPEAAPAPGRGHETILLVEDEPALLRISRRVLENLGYRVLAARGPGEAIQLAREHAGTIHLLMTDVVMPEMNGRDLAKNLLSQYPHLKRLFMSGYTADVIAHHGVLDPGIHFLQKPFTVEALADKVREALGGGDE